MTDNSEGDDTEENKNCNLSKVSKYSMNTQSISHQSFTSSMEEDESSDIFSSEFLAKDLRNVCDYFETLPDDLPVEVRKGSQKDIRDAKNCKKGTK